MVSKDLIWQGLDRCCCTVMSGSVESVGGTILDGDEIGFRMGATSSV